jgi:hypothetical protein
LKALVCGGQYRGTVKINLDFHELRVDIEIKKISVEWLFLTWLNIENPIRE